MLFPTSLILRFSQPLSPIRVADLCLIYADFCPPRSRKQVDTGHRVAARASRMCVPVGVFSVNPSMISSICCGHSSDNGASAVSRPSTCGGDAKRPLKLY